MNQIFQQPVWHLSFIKLFEEHSSGTGQNNDLLSPVLQGSRKVADMNLGPAKIVSPGDDKSYFNIFSSPSTSSVFSKYHLAKY
ncbi:MAG: hypothetical protein SVV67_04025 [Bacillota bacterium]|nr:hypothetical protein [Bacillota bacterium]